MKRDDRGVSTGYLGIFATVLMVVTGMFVVVLSYAASSHQAATAADLSALAGAQAAAQGRDACSAATSIARANHAELQRCVVVGQAVTVEAAVDVQLRFPGAPATVVARATAAPATEPPP